MRYSRCDADEYGEEQVLSEEIKEANNTWVTYMALGSSKNGEAHQ